ncbi:50S ribosomal protein L23 [Metamycoplasma faucium]|uniref:Large ribosomal subunit protein uL23 n=1 Tax=Metamycoplasma faucium TaxID=56142 RepID=A0ABZ2TKR1_9BACT
MKFNDFNNVIKYPILTEKSEILRSNANLYTFAVDVKATKVQVRQAIEFIFDVKVLSVNIVNYDKKPASLGRSKGFKPAVKKAYVKLDPKSKIILFAEEEKALKEQNNKAKANVDAKPKEMSEAEKRAAEKIAKAKAAKSEPAKEKSEKVLTQSKTTSTSVKKDNISKTSVKKSVEPNKNTPKKTTEVKKESSVATKKSTNSTTTKKVATKKADK